LLPRRILAKTPPAPTSEGGLEQFPGQRSLGRVFTNSRIGFEINLKVIADWLGHRDGGKLILGTYSHVRNAHAEEMAKKLVA